MLALFLLSGQPAVLFFTFFTFFTLLLFFTFFTFFDAIPTIRLFSLQKRLSFGELHVLFLTFG